LNDPTNPDELDERLARLADSLLKKRDEAIEGRAASGIERQWREDTRAFEGIDGTANKTDMVDYATGESWVGNRGTAQQPRRSRVIVNIIRGKCETAEGRFADIVLPTDDKNWGLLTSPIPEVAAQVAPAPQAMQMAQPGIMQAAPQAAGIDLQAKKAEAEQRCSAMEEEIEDQLEECQFNAECRKVQRSAVRLGTGVLKGPNVVKSVRRAWIEQTDGADSVYVMKSVEDFKPGSTSRDIWNIYPDPHCGSDPKRGAYIWERDHVLPREVRALIGVPGYQTSQLIKVLSEEPKRTIVQVDKGNNQKAESTVVNKGAPYERWEYHGDVGRDDLEAMGCRCPVDASQAFSACVVFINDRPVKVQLNSLDTGELPYDFFQWVQIEDSPWGIGEPRKLIWQQRIITAAWRAMMDNAGDSSGAQIVIGKDVVPEDGQWEITGKKIWLDESEEGDVTKAFAQYQITNNQVELERIIELALKFTDMESGTPMIAQGEKGSAPETLGGMQLLMQGADTTRRQQVKHWDDQITRPHIGRYYDWNMQYNPNQKIKGDFNVDARGTSVLLVKDAAARSLVQIMQMRNDPEVNIQVDWSKVIKQLFQSMHLDVLKSDEEIIAARQKAAQSPPPVAPAVQAAQIRVDGDLKKTQLKAQADDQISMREAQLTTQEGDKDRQVQIAIEMISEKMQSAELNSVEAQVLAKIKTSLADTAMKLRVQRELSTAGISHEKDVVVGQHMADLYKHHNPQVITPSAEPTGRAKDGQAFTQ
jgi:hypothetical protein